MILFSLELTHSCLRLGIGYQALYVCMCARVVFCGCVDAYVCVCLFMLYMRVCARVLAREIEREEGWALSVRDGFDIPQRVRKVSNDSNRGQSPDRSLR